MPASRLAPIAVLLLALGAGGAAAQNGTGAAFSALFDGDRVWSDFARLASPDLQGRRTGSDGNRLARALVPERFRQAGLTPLAADYAIPFRFTRQDAEQEGVNVVGLCRGTQSADRRAIVVSAHYDHVGVRNGEIYPGADDNASGTAALLAIAALCRRAPWQHDVVFVAFDAEEQGLRGARAFVASPPLDKSRLALNINMDMLSRSATREIYIAGTAYHPELRQALEGVVKRSGAIVRFGHDDAQGKGGSHDDWTMQSDHGPFHAAGIPFLYFGVEDHPDYHKPSDTLDKIEPAFFFNVVATVADALAAMDKALPAPRP
jgi:Zn-dependent M28 family amino/carboxypeptidase